MRLLAYLASFLFLAVVLSNTALYVALERVRRRYPLCDDDDEEALPLTLLAAAFVTECACSAAAFSLAVLAPLLPRHSGDPAAEVRIILLHGLAQTHAVTAVLARRLGVLGFGVVSFSYSSLRPDIAAAAEELRGRILELQQERQGPVYLLGFGIGGLVARYCVRRHRVPGVRRVLTLGTPHLGTLLAPPWPPELARLRPGSEFLTHLAAADRAPDQFEATAVQSELDATILPPENGYYPAAFNVTVRDTGHFTLLFSPRIFALIRENLEAG